MLVIKNFKPVPGTPEQIDKYGNAAFLASECGQDWYECQRQFDPKKIKVMFNKDGVIKSVTDEPDKDGNLDVGMFFPAGMSVAEIDGGLPDGFTIFGEQWVFDGERVVPRQFSTTELEQRVRNNRDKLLKSVDAISPVYWASVDQNKQKEWIDYRQGLLDVPQQPGFPDKVEWPSKPQM